MLVGVLGGGQLGRMLALAGYPLGLQFRLFDRSPESPAEHVAEFQHGDFLDKAALERFFRGVSVITYEFENVPVEAAKFCAGLTQLHPPAIALATAQDRFAEKRLFERLGLPTPAFAPVASAAELAAAIDRVGLPAVLKTRRGGYDGKGQFVLRIRQDADEAWRSLGGDRAASINAEQAHDGAAELILEQFVAFDRELSMLAVRGPTGQTAYYPLVQNLHRDGILRESLAPAPNAPDSLQTLAQDYAERVLHELQYVGVLAIEFFAQGDRLLANEIAPRVHNSGHWTIEGATTSQFENHLRAILGLPLGPTDAIGHSLMLNLISVAPPASELLRIPGAHVHFYGKAARAGRKLGHVTVWADDPVELMPRAAAVRESIQRASAM